MYVHFWSNHFSPTINSFLTHSRAVKTHMFDFGNSTPDMSLVLHRDDLGSAKRLQEAAAAATKRTDGEKKKTIKPHLEVLKRWP
jgi:hypothetical protein